jgi:hypothetical protein
MIMPRLKTPMTAQRTEGPSPVLLAIELRLYHGAILWVMMRREFIADGAPDFI